MAFNQPTSQLQKVPLSRFEVQVTEYIDSFQPLYIDI